MITSVENMSASELLEELKDILSQRDLTQKSRIDFTIGRIAQGYKFEIAVLQGMLDGEYLTERDRVDLILDELGTKLSHVVHLSSQNLN